MNKVYLIITDLYEIKEESPALDKPVMILKTEIERLEYVKLGTVKLAEIDKNEIFNIVNKLINNESIYISVTSYHSL